MDRTVRTVRVDLGPRGYDIVVGRDLLGRAPVALKLVWYASRRRHARLSARALGPVARGVA